MQQNNGIRPANTGDINNIMEIVLATLPIMKAENNPQWDEIYPTAKVFNQDISNGSLYVYLESEKLLGFTCIDGNQPPEYNHVGWNSDSTALCVHRLAVHPASRRQGAGEKLLLHAEYIARMRGVCNLRTDTFSGNAKMNALFTKHGYTKAGEIQLRGIDRPFYCYDKLLPEG